jgi:hypothetical protein
MPAPGGIVDNREGGRGEGRRKDLSQHRSANTVGLAKRQQRRIFGGDRSKARIRSMPALASKWVSSSFGLTYGVVDHRANG